jgi:hypothetical protein
MIDLVHSLNFELLLEICYFIELNFKKYPVFYLNHLSSSVDSQSNGKMCYVSVLPKYLCEVPYSEYCLHLKYELLPPHPPFVTSVSLKLKNVILLNSGDLLFAILIPTNQNLFDQEGVVENKKSQKKKHLECYCHQKMRRSLEDPAQIFEIEDDVDEPTDFISFVNQGFSMLEEQESNNESLPNSPFDCTKTVIPCTITSLSGNVMLKNVFEHRCFRHSDKGNFTLLYFINA